MAKKTNSHIIEQIKYHEMHEKKIEKIAKTQAKFCRTKEEREDNELGYEYGINNKPIPDNYQNNDKFKSGYDRGQRTRKIEEYKKKEKIVEQMVKENIPLENAPDDIKNNETLVSHYRIFQLKEQREATKLKK